MSGDSTREVGGIETVRMQGQLERSWNDGSAAGRDIPREMKIAPGSRIGEQYEVRRVLGGEGKSGMGIVYVCYDHFARQLYALKTFQDKYLYSDRIQESFRHEALAWVLLDAHPNIVQAVSVEAHDNRLFIVLEYIEPDDRGRNTLTQFLKSSISPVQAVEWALQFCDGMTYAASQGVTPHRDIKPDNLMIARDGTLKITDFGLARFWEGTLRTYDQDVYAGMAGTCPWMAPEQFDGISDLRSDIYSFGVILYQMVNGGRPPFTADSPEAYRRMHGEAPLPPLHDKLFIVIKKCLKKKREERYQDFRSLRADLERHYRSRTHAEPPAPASRTEPGMWEYNNRGLALYNVGLVDEAIWVYRKALRSGPVFIEQHKSRLATVHNNLGVAYDARGDIDMAIDEYRAALSIDPGLADAHNNLGTAFRAKGLLDEAIAEYLRALALRHDHAMARHNLGLSYACRGDHEAAVGEYKEAIRLKPGFVEARINLGLAFAMQGRMDRAIVEYRRAARLSPGDAIIHFNMAGALRAVGRLEETIAEYRAALNIEPGNADAHYNLGLSLEESGSLQDAINEYIRTLRLEAGHGPAMASLEKAMKKSGTSDAAVTECLRILRKGLGSWTR